MAISFWSFQSCESYQPVTESRRGQQLSSSQEMLALGAANILGSVWTAYPAAWHAMGFMTGADAGFL